MGFLGIVTTYATVRLIGISALNVIGVIVYLQFATQGWIEPEVANIPGAAGGGALLWGISALPTLLAFIVFDVLWLISSASCF